MHNQSELETEEDIIFQRDRAVVRILFNRPSAQNALTDAMRETIASAIPKLARDPDLYAVVIGTTQPDAFCVGRDVRTFANLSRTAKDQACAQLADEYALHWSLDCFFKPTVVLIQGAMMGSAVGLTHFCTHRVAAETYAFAMPETSFGFFPDAGTAHVLSRLPHSVGVFLALTGRTIVAADAYDLGLITHCIASSEFEGIVAGLADAHPIDPLLDSRHQSPGRGALASHYECIAESFSAPTVEEVLSRLERKRIEYHAPEWIDGVIADLSSRSPTALVITHRHLQRCKRMSLRENLIADYKLACAMLQSNDFYEGVGAMSHDKHKPPQWAPARVADVIPEMIERFFSSTDGDAFALPSRDEMLAARV